MKWNEMKWNEMKWNENEMKGVRTAEIKSKRGGKRKRKEETTEEVRSRWKKHSRHFLFIFLRVFFLFFSLFLLYCFSLRKIKMNAMKMLPLPGTLRGYYISSNRIESKWRIPLIFLRTYVQKRYIRNKSCTCRPEETRKRRLRISCTNGIR